MESKSEEMRLERLQKKARIRFIVVIVMSVVMYAVMFYQSGWYFFWGEERYRIGEDDPMWMNVVCMIIGSLIVTGIFFGIFYRLVVHRAYEKFNQEFKNKYVLSVIGEMGLFENLGYQLRGGMTYDEVRNAAVISCGDKRYFSSEDMLTGCYQGFSFRYCDVVTKYLAGSGKNMRVETIFEGQIIQFTDFDRSKESHGYVQIFEKKFISSIKGWTEKHKILTENEVFNSRFEVFATDEHNAFYILTPKLLELIMRFEEDIDGQIAITFRGSSMFVALNRLGSMFDGKLDRKIEDQKELIRKDVEMLRHAGDILI